jgi:hypothetical protein
MSASVEDWISYRAQWVAKHGIVSCNQMGKCQFLVVVISAREWSGGSQGEE